MNRPPLVANSKRIIGLVIAVVACALLLATGRATAATTWQASVGADTPDHAIQANAFLPRDITVDVGDTVTWTLRSGEIHTLTFLSGAPRPPLIIPSGPGIAFNPVAVAPAGGPTYDGTTFTNSGLLAVPGQAFSLTFTAPGDFDFVCLVHATMTGVMHVAPAGTPYPHNQAFYDRQATPEAARIIATGRALAGQARADVGGGNGVVAGTGQLFDTHSVADLRFYPDRKVAHVGDTVTWTNDDPETPHTVTFGTEPPGGLLGAFAPAGTDGPGHGTISSPSQSVNSGFIGADLPFGTQFRATFTMPGVYAYFCALHDDLGMTGEVVVLP